MTPPVVPADPRVSVLLNFTQALIGKYVELATGLARLTDDPAVHADLRKHVDDVVTEARAHYAEIAAAPEPTSSDHWTAPEAGWYEFARGREPRRMNDDEAERARAAMVGYVVARFEKGDLTMASGIALDGSPVILDVDAARAAARAAGFTPGPSAVAVSWARNSQGASNAVIPWAHE